MKKIFTFIVVLILLFSFNSTQLTFANGYTDVPDNYTYYEEIMFLQGNGVINPGTEFGVNDIVTREEVAVMVAKAVGLKGLTPVDTKFSDVKENNENSGYIQAAVNAGIINGYEDGTFKPRAKVTRGHMAAFIARGFKLSTQANITFKDVVKGSTSFEAVRQLAHEGITTGYVDGTFKPNENLSRAHISVFLARAMSVAEFLSPEEKAINIVKNSPYFDRDIIEIDVIKVDDNVFEVVWGLLLGNDAPSLTNSWTIKDGNIIDPIYKSGYYNELFWNNPFFEYTNLDEITGDNHFPFAGKLTLFAQDGTFLGSLLTNPLEIYSIYNELGSYGNKYESKSIWNQNGIYGSVDSIYSPFNPNSISPPFIVANYNTIVGSLSVNPNIPGAIPPDMLSSTLFYLGQ